jgi:CDP-glucose 4,6-dehydratase
MAGAMTQRMVNPQFWRNKNVLVTGHTGFKGAWLCLWLIRMGAKVTGVALLPPTTPSLFKTVNIGPTLARSVLLDIRDRGKLVRVFRQAKPEIVFHLAAQPLVWDSYKDPVSTYAINVMGTVNVLEAVRAARSVRAVVNVTTDKCYENVECMRGYREEDPLGGYDPYSSSKACSEIVTAAYRRSFFHPNEYKVHGVAIATARAGNVIGGGDWARDRLVPDCIRSLKKGVPVVLRSPNAVRPWQHVLDPLCGYLMLAEKLFSDGAGFASPWNFGPAKKDVATVAEVADRIVRQWGDGIRVKIALGKHPHEAGLLMLDITKARKELGWRPRLTVTQALDWTVEGYRALSKKKDPRRVILQQIDRYKDIL